MEIKAYASDGLFMFYLRGIFGVSSKENITLIYVAKKGTFL